MTTRIGANGQRMVEKKKPEVIQEILEVNPNVVEEEVIEEVAEEEETDEEL